MLITGEHFSQHRTWLVVTIVLTILASAWYAIACVIQHDILKGSSAPGLTYGIAGGIIILFEFALWPRKTLVRHYRIGRTQTWMRAHIWLGLLSVPLVIMHTGFRLGGWLPMSLLLLFVLVILSGIWGLIMQQYIPRMMYEQLPQETIHTQIGRVAKQLEHEALAIIQAARTSKSEKASVIVTAIAQRTDQDDQQTELEIVNAGHRPWQEKLLERNLQPLNISQSEQLEKFYRAELQPYLQNISKRDSPFCTAGRAEQIFDALRNKLGAGDANRCVDALEEICSQRRQLSQQLALHAWLHSWLTIHLPLSAALVILLLLHIWSALKYV